MKEKHGNTQIWIHKIVDHIEKSDKIPSLSTTMEIELNHIPFHLRAHEGSAVLSFQSWTSALKFMKIVRRSHFVKRLSLRQLQLLLNKIDLTFYLQNEKFALIGPRAGLIIPKILTIASLLVKK